MFFCMPVKCHFQFLKHHSFQTFNLVLNIRPSVYHLLCISNGLADYSPIYAHFYSFYYLFDFKIGSYLVSFRCALINSACLYVIITKIDLVKRFKIKSKEAIFQVIAPKLQLPLFMIARQTLILPQHYHFLCALHC